jgi:type I restriction enzyme M protein
VLDSDTRRKIDTLRNVLVGKIPNPQTQVEQITTGLIYKFMDDMDQESIEMGGEGSFFVGDYEKYAWKNLLDPKLSGVDKVKLYSDAIESMYLNPSAPQLFRDIFKNAFLPFKDPSTLNMFLKEINEFHYSHSEKLGDAFEYLISIMGSQGDAGQFRTPRHIIDFIVEIINPQKNETILDPACGTAGFLISSYKHILKTNTDKKLGDKLSAEDKKKVGENVTGYDISPEMIRLSLVNMYLHGFSTPKIDEYDTLSSEDEWNEYFDVILANPPFFSPKGGIQPHKRFGVQSTKAEVLFTSYILEHLKPNGRAGIIVPEGIIFQNGKAYKELRKQLIENGLVGVISLPAGVFNPYSGVKTSILILNKKLNKQLDSVFFAEVKNDGFSLGAQRTPIKENDIPSLISDVRDNDRLINIKKSDILLTDDISLSKSKYIKTVINTNFKIVKLSDVLLDKPVYGSGAKKSDYDGEVRYIRITDIDDFGRLKEDGLVSPSEVEDKYFLNVNDFLIARSGSVGRTYLHKQKGKYQYAGYLIRFPLNKELIVPEYLLYISKSKSYKDWINKIKKDGTISNINAKEYSSFEFPLPPIEVQQQIVDELEGYQKIIDGCRQVVENYKPIIDIDPSWEMVKLGGILDITRGASPRPIKDFITDGEGENWIKIGDASLSSKYILKTKEKITNEGAKKSKIVREGDFILSNSMSFGRPYIMGIRGCIHDGWLLLKYEEESMTEDFLYYILSSSYVYNQFKQLATGGVVNNLNKDLVSSVKIPLLNIDQQNEIASKLNEERKVIEGNKKLIETYTQKIKDKISKVWGESE